MTNQPWQDADKEIFKNLIVAPQDGCKTMAVGTVTIIGIYVVLMSNLFDKKFPLHTPWGIIGIFTPIILFILAALLFGMGYLPDRIAKVFPKEETSTAGTNVNQGEDTARKRAEDFEKTVRYYLYRGLVAFWAGIISGLLFLILYPKPN